MEDLNNEKLQAIRSSFSTVKGVNKIEADLTTGKLYVDTVLPTSTIHQKVVLYQHSTFTNKRLLTILN